MAAFDWYVPNGNPRKNSIDAICQSVNCIRQNDSEELESLLDSGIVDCDTRVLIQGSRMALIMIAVQYNQYDCVEVLCKSGCNLSPQIRDQTSPLMLAIHNKNYDIVQVLLKYRASLTDVCVTYGRTALFHAVTDGTTDIARLLINHGADVNKKDRFGRTPLLLACQSSGNDMIQLLLENGSDPFVVDKSDTSCVHYLYQKLQRTSSPLSGIMKALLEKMSSISTERTEMLLNSANRTFQLDYPLAILISNWRENQDLIQNLHLLVQAGANYEKPSVLNRKTPIEIACDGNYIQLARALLRFGLKLEPHLDVLSKSILRQETDLSLVSLLLKSSQKLRKFVFSRIKAFPSPNGQEKLHLVNLSELLMRPLTLKEICRICILDTKKTFPHLFGILPASLVQFIGFQEI